MKTQEIVNQIKNDHLVYSPLTLLVRELINFCDWDYDYCGQGDPNVNEVCQHLSERTFTKTQIFRQIKELDDEVIIEILEEEEIEDFVIHVASLIADRLAIESLHEKWDKKYDISRTTFIPDVWTSATILRQSGRWNDFKLPEPC